MLSILLSGIILLFYYYVRTYVCEYMVLIFYGLREPIIILFIYLTYGNYTYVKQLCFSIFCLHDNTIWI